MKLKDYEIPKDGMDDVLDAAELQKYNLKNFDLSQLEADPIFTSAPPVVVAPVSEAAFASPDPMPGPVVPTSIAWPTSVSPVVTSAVSVEPPRAIADPPPSALEQELGFNVAAQESPWSDGFALGGEPASEHDDLTQFAMNLGDVAACVELPVTGLAYNPFSPSQQSSSLPRWILVSMGGFFVSAAALAITFCVVLLRPSATPAAQAPAPTPPVVTASATIAQPSSCSDKARAEVPRAVAAPEVRTSAPPAANVKQVASTAQRSVVSHPAKLVRRFAHRARNTASPAPDPSATRKSRPPQDELDQLLGGT